MYHVLSFTILSFFAYLTIFLIVQTRDRKICEDRGVTACYFAFWSTLTVSIVLAITNYNKDPEVLRLKKLDLEMKYKLDLVKIETEKENEYYCLNPQNNISIKFCEKCYDKYLPHKDFRNHLEHNPNYERCIKKHITE